MPLWGIVVYYSPCEQHLLCLLDWGGEKGGSAWITSNLWGRRSQTLWLVNLVLSRQIGFFECKRLFIDIPMVITKPTVASAQLLDPGWKLYPSNMLCMLNKYLYSNHAEYFSSTPNSSKQKKGSAGRVTFIHPCVYCIYSAISWVIFTQTKDKVKWNLSPRG